MRTESLEMLEFQMMTGGMNPLYSEQSAPIDGWPKQGIIQARNDEELDEIELRAIENSRRHI